MHKYSTKIILTNRGRGAGGTKHVVGASIGCKNVSNFSALREKGVDLPGDKLRRPKKQMYIDR